MVGFLSCMSYNQKIMISDSTCLPKVCLQSLDRILSVYSLSSEIIDFLSKLIQSRGNIIINVVI